MRLTPLFFFARLGRPPAGGAARAGACLLFLAAVCGRAQDGTSAWASPPAIPPLALTSVHQDEPEETLAGPAWADFRLTLEAGRRQEAAGPLFYAQQTEPERQLAFPPFFVETRTPEVEATEIESLYPLFTWRRFGTEYRAQFFELFSFSGGQTQAGPQTRLFTLFPLYFQRRSENPGLNYTALVPFYGHLQNRLFRDDIKFFLFPVYAETRKKEVVTDNYLYPIFHVRSGGNVKGWQVWPITGAEHKTTTTFTNRLGEAEIAGGYNRFFALWPFYFKDQSGLGTTNQENRLVVMPFYSRLRSPLRDENSYGWPFGYWRTDDRGQKYRERDFLWPLFEVARGSKTTTRIFPFYSRAAAHGLESDFYMWPVYKSLRMETPAVERERFRIAFFLYSDIREKNRQTGENLHQVDCWPFYTYQRGMDQKERLHVLSLLEPFFPGNDSIVRGYSQLWSFWRSEKDARSGKASQSLLWNLYRHESAPGAKKFSLLFGLFQYQSSPEGANWRVCYIPFGKKPGNVKAPVRP